MTSIQIQAVLGVIIGYLAVVTVVARRTGGAVLARLLSQPFMLVRVPLNALLTSSTWAGNAVRSRRQAIQDWLYRGHLRLPVVLLALLTPLWGYLVAGTYKMGRSVFLSLGQSEHGPFVAVGVAVVTALIGLLFWDLVGVWPVLPFRVTTRRSRILALVALGIVFGLLVGVYHGSLARVRADEEYRAEIAEIDLEQADAELAEAMMNATAAPGDEVDLTSRFAAQRATAERHRDANRTSNVVQAYILSAGEALLSPSPFVLLGLLGSLALTIALAAIAVVRFTLTTAIALIDRLYDVVRGFVLAIVGKEDQLLQAGTPPPPATPPPAGAPTTTNAPGDDTPASPDDMSRPVWDVVDGADEPTVEPAPAF